MRILGPVPAAQRLDKTNDFTPFLKAAVHQRQIDEMR